MKTKPIIVGIAGGTGSGKTTLTRAISEKINSSDAVIIQHDSYYFDRSHLTVSERDSLNYDHPDALESELLVRHLKELISGNPVEVPNYDFSSHCRKNNTTSAGPGKVILVEGILLFAKAELRELIDIKVFVDADDDIRFARRLERDISERNRSLDSVITQYLSTTRPMHIEFVVPSKKYADIIVTDALNPVVIEAMAAFIEHRLGCMQ